jgi:hypothetical protein
MIQPSDKMKGIAPPNAAFARRPEAAPERAWRWLLRLAGQFRRQYLSRFRQDYVARMKAARRGECRQCGACCDLTFHCPFLTAECRCNSYEKRPVTCRTFPIDAADLKLTQVPCGHYYVSHEEERVRANSTG